MTDRPIPFSPDMVRAILAGRKTQTRRVLRGLPGDFGRTVWPCYLDSKRTGTMCYPPRIGEGPNGARLSPVPVAPGDRLYVREAHFAYGHWELTQELTKAGKQKRKFVRRWDTPVAYDLPCDPFPDTDLNRLGWYARRGMHHHKVDTRTTLHVIDVRVQRVQDITNDDAIAEGCPGFYAPCAGDGGVTDGMTPAENFQDLWNTLNAPRGYGWDVNPWVTATTFEPEFCNISEARR